MPVIQDQRKGRAKHIREGRTWQTADACRCCGKHIERGSRYGNYCSNTCRIKSQEFTYPGMER